jgi:hypothetical protein
MEGSKINKIKVILFQSCKTNNTGHFLYNVSYHIFLLSSEKVQIETLVTPEKPYNFNNMLKNAVKKYFNFDYNLEKCVNLPEINKKNLFKLFFYIDKIIRNFKPDLIVVTDFSVYCILLSLYLKYMFPKKFLLIHYHLKAHKYKILNSVLGRIGLNRKEVGFITNSYKLKNEIIKFWGICNNKIFIRPWRYKFDNIDVYNNDFKKLYLVGFIGNLYMNKGIIDFINYFIKNKKNRAIISGRLPNKKIERDIIINKLNQLREINKNVKVIIGEIDDKKYNNIINSCKFIALPWKEERMNRVSGQLFDFINNEIPIILPKKLAHLGLGTNDIVPGSIIYNDLNRLEEGFNIAFNLNTKEYQKLIYEIKKFKKTFNKKYKNLKKEYQKYILNKLIVNNS